MVRKTKPSPSAKTPRRKARGKPKAADRSANGIQAQPAGTSPFWKAQTIEELAAEQGIQPVADPRILRADFWPESESVDEFLAWLKELRREGR
jgi:hypothetical protein